MTYIRLSSGFPAFLFDVLMILRQSRASETEHLFDGILLCLSYIDEVLQTVGCWVLKFTVSYQDCVDPFPNVLGGSHAKLPLPPPMCIVMSKKVLGYYVGAPCHETCLTTPMSEMYLIWLIERIYIVSLHYYD